MIHELLSAESFAGVFSDGVAFILLFTLAIDDCKWPTWVMCDAVTELTTTEKEVGRCSPLNGCHLKLFSMAFLHQKLTSGES